MLWFHFFSSRFCDVPAGHSLGSAGILSLVLLGFALMGFLLIRCWPAGLIFICHFYFCSYFQFLSVLFSERCLSFLFCAFYFNLTSWLWDLLFSFWRILLHSSLWKTSWLAAPWFLMYIELSEYSRVHPETGKNNKSFDVPTLWSQYLLIFYFPLSFLTAIQIFVICSF